MRRLLLGPGMVRLERPALRHKERALGFREEFFSNNEPIIFGSELLDKTERYEDWLEAVARNADPGTVSQEWVLTDTYFAVEGSGGVYERSFSHEGEDADIYAIRL